MFYSLIRTIVQKVNYNQSFRKASTYLKNSYNRWYWQERVINKSNKETGVKPYYIIRRYAENMGLCSYVISNLSQINYALMNEYRPIVDMKNFNSTEIKGSRNLNTWELYFCQTIKTSLQDAYKTRNTILSDGGCKKYTPTDSVVFLHNKYELNYWRNLMHSYAVFSSEVQIYMDHEYKSCFEGRQNVLGILCRGTDYLELKPKGHPIQPDVQDVIAKAREVMKLYSCDYIYLATEDVRIQNLFDNEFPVQIIINTRQYKDYRGDFLVKTSNKRKNDQYLTNLEYLSSLNMLSKCRCFIAGRTSGTLMTMLMNDNYEYTYFWDIGTYC